MIELDGTYLFAKSNYQCAHCKQAVTESTAEYHIFDNAGEYVPSNMYLTCYTCRTKNAPTPQGRYGKLIVITGAMYSQKSNTTRAIYDKYRVFDQLSIWVKPDTDSRSENMTMTHDLRIVSPAQPINAKRPDLALEQLMQYNIVAFDEAQFFSFRIIYVIHQLLAANKIVIVNGLKQTASGNIFGAMHYLLAEADEIISLKAVCSCCGKIDSATRTRAQVQNNPTIKVGGTDIYYVVCPQCDWSHRNEKEATTESIQS